MITTTYKIGRHTVRIHDPAETAEAKAKRQARLEKACIRFMRHVESHRAVASVKK
jgi:hypothetical protein